MIWIAKSGQKMLVDPGTLPYWEGLGWQVDADANAVGDLTQEAATYLSVGQTRVDVDGKYAGDIAAAVAAEGQGKTFHVNGTLYSLGSTVTLGNNTQFIGPSQYQTTIRRSANVPLFTATGVSTTVGGPQVTGVAFKGVRFDDQANGSADLVQLTAVTQARFEDCFFYGPTGRWVLLNEVYDSRFDNCDFEWGGNSTGTVPGVEMQGNTGGFGLTNNVYFAACRMESFRGTALAATGTNVNEIYLERVKMEAIASRQAFMKWTSANNIGFDHVQLTAGDNTGGSIASLANFTGCNVVSGSLFMEMAGAATTTITNYASLATSPGVNLDIHLYGPTAPTTGYAVTWDGANPTTTRVRLIPSSFLAPSVKALDKHSRAYGDISGDYSVGLAAGANAGTSPPSPAVVTFATDRGGRISWGTGTTPAAGNMANVTYSTAFAAIPHVVLTPCNAATAALQPFVTNQTTTGFIIGVNVAPAASQTNGTYSVTYYVLPNTG